MRTRRFVRWTPVALLLSVLAASSARAEAAKPAAPADVDLDLVARAVAPLGQDPAFGGVVTPKGADLVRFLVDELPVGSRAQLALWVVDARMLAGVAIDVG